MEKIADLSLLMRILRQHVTDMEVADLSDRQILILETLARSGGEMDTSDLIEVLAFSSRSVMSTVLADLETSKGLIETRRNREDRRKRIVSLNKHGKRVLKQQMERGLKTYEPLARVVHEMESSTNAEEFLRAVLDKAIMAVEERLNQLKERRNREA